MKTAPVPLSTEPVAPQGEADAEKLSAWLDGELDGHECDPLLAGLLRRPDLQRRYAGWCLVGDALRSGEVVAGHSPALCARINAALQDEPALLAPAALRPALRPQLVRRHLATGFAVAAAAAVLVFVAVPQLSTDSPTVKTVAGAGDVAGGSGGVVNKPVTPVALSNTRNPRLDPYIQAHREFMGTGVMPAAAVYLRSGNEGDR